MLLQLQFDREAQAMIVLPKSNYKNEPMTK